MGRCAALLAVVREPVHAALHPHHAPLATWTWTWTWTRAPLLGCEAHPPRYVRAAAPHPAVCELLRPTVVPWQVRAALLGNRTACLLAMKESQLALEDAEAALELVPNWVKGAPALRVARSPSAWHWTQRCPPRVKRAPALRVARSPPWANSIPTLAPWAAFTRALARGHPHSHPCRTPPGHFRVGCAKEAVGDTAGALEAYRAAQELEPDNQEVAKRLAKLGVAAEPSGAAASEAA
eukprot:1889995-Prymnesium_polylepis.1